MLLVEGRRSTARASVISVHDASSRDGLGALSVFRRDFYAGLTARGDGLFELCDALLCAEGPVATLVGLSLAGEHRRGHGGLYDALNNGRVDVDRLRFSVAAQPIPRVDGRIVLAVDVSNWLRPDAATSPERLFCHTYARGKGQAQMIPGWPYSMVAALESGRSSWTALLDAVRLGPADDAAAVTAAQVRQVVGRLISAGHLRPDDPPVLVVFDSGYDLARLAHELTDLPVQVAGRVRSDRVFARPAPAHRPGKRGRPAKHGGLMSLAQPATWHAPQQMSATATSRYGTAVACSWDSMHPRLTRRSAWIDHAGPLPVIAGTLIRLQVQRLPGEHDPKPVWLWTTATLHDPDQLDRIWHAYLRRFDLEHAFRLLKQTLGWTRPRIRTPQAADRWTWLILAAHTQLRLARGATADLRHPWEKPAPPGRLSPARVRRGFRNIHRKIASPASAPKQVRPGPGRPPGVPNRTRAIRHDVGKTVKRSTTLASSQNQKP
jgi:hypothetical protein